MIAMLKGILEAMGPNWIILDVNGVCYQLFCTSKLLDHCTGHEGPMTVHTELIVREDMMSLYGFADPVEKDWFRLLQTVQGVGMKAALAILSIGEPALLYQAIAQGNHQFLARADGIGPKLATRICHELKDKVAQMIPSGVPVGAPQIATMVSAKSVNIFDDALSALTNLGYKPIEATQALTFAKQHAAETVEDAIRLSLGWLSQRKS